MPCALLICRDENDVVDTDPGRVAEFDPFVERMGKTVLGSPRLRAATTATTVRVRDGNVLIADGPFAEFLEQIAGLLLSSESPDEAIEVASQIPTAQFGTIEVRPSGRSSDRAGRGGRGIPLLVGAVAAL